MVRQLRPGDLFERVYATAAGEVTLLAEVEVEGATLLLKDIAVYPTKAAALDLGLRTVIALRAQLAADVADLGFESLRITGRRMSGAAPGKEVDLTVDLGEYRK